MNYKFQITLVVLAGAWQFCASEKASYEFEIPSEGANETESAIKNDNVLDDKNLNKRRSHFYGERDGSDRNSDEEYTHKSHYEYSSGDSDFDGPRKTYYDHHDKERRYENRGHDEYAREKDRSRMTLSNRGHGGSSDDWSSHSFFPRNKMAGRMDWESSDGYYASGQGYRFKEGRYPSGYSEELEVGKSANENRRVAMPLPHSSREFVPGKEMVTRMNPRFNMPSPLDFPVGSELALDDSDLCKPEKAIVINLKTECPLSKHSRSRVVHKYLFAPKTHLNAQSSLLPTDDYFTTSPGASSSYYYI